MAVMPIPAFLPPTFETQALLTLGLRALWLQQHLAGRAAAFLHGRDRGILTLVATWPWGISQTDLNRQLRTLGLAVEPAASLETSRLVHEGWLSQITRDNATWIDLPTEDTAWIAEQVRSQLPLISEAS